MTHYNAENENINSDERTACSGVIVRWLCAGDDRLQSINYGIEDGTLTDIEEATKSKFYEYDTDWESSRDGLLLLYYQFIFKALNRD